MVRSIAGIPEMGADASMGRRVLEGLLPMTGNIVGGAVNAYRAAPTMIQGLGSAVGSIANRAVVAPALATGGSYLGEQAGGQKGAFLGGLAGGMSPALLERPMQYAAGLFHRAANAAPEGNPVVPSATQVGKASQQLSDALGKYTGDKEGIEPTFGMLSGPGGMETQKTLAAFGSPPAASAEEYPLEFMPKLADLAVIQRRELPNRSLPGDPLGDNVDVLRLAQQAAAQRASPADTHDRGVIDAMQGWIKNNMGNQNTDMTEVRMLMQELADETGHSTNITALQGKIKSLDQIAPPKVDPVTGETRYITDFGRARQWASDIGKATQAPEGTRPGLAAGQFKQVYGAAKNAMQQAAIDRNVSPNALNTAMDIEHRELSAQDLGQLMLKTIKSGKSTFAKGIGSVMDLMPGDDPNQYRRLTGGEFEPGGAPAPLPGSGDIRQTIGNITTLGKSTVVPPGQPTGPMEQWRAAREALGVPGIGALGSGRPAAPCRRTWHRSGLWRELSPRCHPAKPCRARNDDGASRLADCRA
jgi:hypothetical protein